MNQFAFESVYCVIVMYGKHNLTKKHGWGDQVIFLPILCLHFDQKKEKYFVVASANHIQMV